jgi:PIN domain nuclease of toxin-antitoxin system
LTVLDAAAVLALLKDEPAASAVAELIAGPQRGELTAVGLVEVVDHLVRVVGVDEEELLIDLAGLRLLDAIVVDPELAVSAGRLRARHHRPDSPLTLAQCVAAEAARRLGRPLATADPHLLALCHAEGILVSPLPDARGTRWLPS